MKFLYPAFLFALFTVIIPVIIHFFSFRRHRTIYFSHVGFLKDIKKESRKKSRIKQLLMLLARILTIVFLVFAFAQPFIPLREEARESGNNVVGVYIDNSFSMNALSEKGQLLERARAKAAEIGHAYPPGTKFRLFTNDMEPRHQNLFSQEQFIRQVAEVAASPQTVPLSRIHNRFRMENPEMDAGQSGTLFFISDFQRSITDPENFNEGPVFDYFLPLTPGEVNNLYIDTCWMEVPAHGLDQEENIFVKIKNHSDEDYQNLPLNLYLNDSLKSITNFSVEAQDEITTNLKYKNLSGGIQLGKIEITDYPFTHDNTWFLSYFTESTLQALAIFNKSEASKEGLRYISALFKNDPYVELSTMDAGRLQISQLPLYNAIFLINPGDFPSGLLNELTRSVEKGTSLVLFPPTGKDPSFYNRFLTRFGAARVSGRDTTQQQISGIDFDHRFFENVFRKREENALYPEIRGHLKFQQNTRSDESILLWFQNNDKALSVLPYGKGKVWIFSFPLEKKNEAFARDILFVPSLYNIVLNSLPDQQIAYTIGSDRTFSLPPGRNKPLETTFEVENKNTGEQFIPGVNITDQGTRLNVRGMIEKAGHYLIKSDGETIGAMAFNYDRKESDLRYFKNGELKTAFETAGRENAMVLNNINDNFSEVYDEIQKGKQLWQECLLLALLFILAEVLIARFWKQ